MAGKRSDGSEVLDASGLENTKKNRSSITSKSKAYEYMYVIGGGYEKLLSIEKSPYNISSLQVSVT